MLWLDNKVINFVAARARAAVIHCRVESTVQCIISCRYSANLVGCIHILFNNAVVRWALFSTTLISCEKMWKAGRGKKMIRWVVRLKMSTIYSLYHWFYNTWLLFKFHLKIRSTQQVQKRLWEIKPSLLSGTVLDFVPEHHTEATSPTNPYSFPPKWSLFNRDHFDIWVSWPNQFSGFSINYLRFAMVPGWFYIINLDYIVRPIQYGTQCRF